MLVWIQQWEEAELGWSSRPDGASIHESREDHRAFIKDYWDSMPDQVPTEYERPRGTPYMQEVTEEYYNQMKQTKNGLRLYSTEGLFINER